MSGIMTSTTITLTSAVRIIPGSLASGSIPLGNVILMDPQNPGGTVAMSGSPSALRALADALLVAADATARGVNILGDR